jgi:outer membrane receptor for ferric coprogen and ferric-rhodotorulic acid
MSPRTILIATFGVVAVSAGGAALAQTTFLPGLYETQTREAGSDEVETTRDCLTPQEAKQKTLEIALASALKSKSCTYAQRSVGGGKFALAGTCSQGGMKSTFKQTGTYSTTSMTMNTKLSMSMGGQPISVDIITTQRRVAPTCPAGSDDE